METPLSWSRCDEPGEIHKTYSIIFDVFGIEIVVIGYLSGTSFVGIFLRD